MTTEESLANIDLLGKKYKDMSTGFRDAFTKQEFRDGRAAQRMAGETDIPAEDNSALTKEERMEIKYQDAPVMTPGVDDIFSYDTKAFGAGSDDGTQRLSKIDLKNLKRQGYALEDIIDYSDKITASGDVLQGEAAKNLLERFKRKVANNADNNTNTDTNTDNNNTNTDNDDNDVVVDNDDDNIIIDSDDSGANTNDVSNSINVGNDDGYNIGNIYANQNQNWTQNIQANGNNNYINAGVDSSNNFTGGSTKIYNYYPGGYEFYS